MESRKEKFEGSEKLISRSKKNIKLYEEINKTTIDNFVVFSNATVIGENETNQIDVEKIKKILDTKYNDAPKRKSIQIEEEEYASNDIENTKEYDINAILDRAKSEISVTYEEERIKKPNTDQYEILKNLDLNTKEENDEVTDAKTDEESITLTKDEPKELLDLINTIVINESKLKEENTEVALDLFEDLKADEGEEVSEPVKINNEERQKEFEKTQIKIEQINLTEEEENKSFETKETTFKKSDFESLDDEDEKGSVLLKIFIVIIAIAFVVGMYFFLTNFLDIKFL